MYCSMDSHKYPTSTPCGSQDCFCLGFSCIITLVPGGTTGLFLKYPLTSNAICAESFGYYLAGHNRLNVIWDYFRRRHHRRISNIFPTPHIPTMKWFLHVQMDRSAAFIHSIWGGTICNATDCCMSKVLSKSESSLSSQCVAGLNSPSDSPSWTFL